ncbi:RNA polymerase sigma factor [Streptomyces sp. LUP47B]|uniref:RNA polymerase sigma factor n=1 Tax=Streptomyces sp. LUP47B TaxID=1890286 RepID=UPI00159F3172|nr:sigma-70 family RNA polymerase sigma factor [Streptomyces sp. LUP47B]
MAIYSRWETAGPPENPRAYLYRSIRNAEYRFKRNSNGLSQLLDIDLLDPADGRQTDELPEVEGANDIRQMPGSLSERQRAIIYVRYFQDMTNSRIALVLGLSEGSINKHLVMAKRRLKKLMQERGSLA